MREDFTGAPPPRSTRPSRQSCNSGKLTKPALGGAYATTCTTGLAT